MKLKIELLEARREIAYNYKTSCGYETNIVAGGNRLQEGKKT